jgi:O-antigen ligase
VSDVSEAADTVTPRPRRNRLAAATLAWQLLAAAAMFGGVYFWSIAVLAGTVIALLVAVRPQVAPRGSARVLDLALIALLVAVALQIVPLPISVIRVASPVRDVFVKAVSLQASSVEFLPLSVDTGATTHAWLSLFCIVATFWSARAIFAHGGIRTFARIIAGGAIVLVVVAFAQHASGSTLVYGFWQPRDVGARPLGPFINRNHFGTWSLMAICLCVGYLQWRSEGRHLAGAWRARVAAWLDARRLVLHLAVVLLAAAVALGSSRSSLVALGCAAGYVALAAPTGPRRRASLGALAALSVIAMLGYGDGQQLLQRVDETRRTGMANRLAIWRDTVPMIRDFPVAGVGAGAFASAMRVYQTSPRTYYHNEAHNQYLQLAAEGGLLLVLPAVAVTIAFLLAAARQLHRRRDPVRWMRIAAGGALVGVAVQSIWETGLTLPANGMFAAALAAILVHPSHSTANSQSTGERQESK